MNSIEKLPIIRNSLVAVTVLVLTAAACGEDEEEIRLKHTLVSPEESGIEEIDEEISWRHVHLIRTQGDDLISKYDIQFGRHIIDPIHLVSDTVASDDGRTIRVAKSCLQSLYDVDSGAVAHVSNDADIVVTPPSERLPQLSFNVLNGVLVASDEITDKQLDFMQCDRTVEELASSIDW